MLDKKSGLRRLLIAAGCGTLLAALMAVGNYKYKEAGLKSLHAMTDTMTTTLVYDTVCFKSTRDISRCSSIECGYYDEYKDIAVKHHFIDSTNTRVGRAIARDMNEEAVFADYHEVKHALNHTFLVFINGQCSPSVMVADELSARVAEVLARLSELPGLQAGATPLRVSYRLPTGYTLKELADDAFISAMDHMRSVNEVYVPDYIRNSELRNARPRRMQLLNADEMINEYMTFEIDGHRQNLLKLASEDTRNRVYKFLNQCNGK